MSDSYRIFDRKLLPLRRARGRGGDADYLIKAARDALAERLAGLNRPVKTAGLFGRGLDQAVFSEPAPKVRALSLGPEEILNAEEKSLDAVVSSLELHWVNDLPGVLIQIRRALKPGGLFLAVLFGGETLRELRRALVAAEEEVEGRVSPRVSPFADVRDAGDLLARAGFASPVADVEPLTVTYADAFRLMHDLRAMGETNLLTERRKGFTRRGTLKRAAEVYTERSGDKEGRVPATFHLLFLTAFASEGEGSKPRKPGSKLVGLEQRFSMKKRAGKG